MNVSVFWKYQLLSLAARPTGRILSPRHRPQPDAGADFLFQVCLLSKTRQTITLEERGLFYGLFYTALAGSEGILGADNIASLGLTACVNTMEQGNMMLSRIGVHSAMISETFGEFVLQRLASFMFTKTKAKTKSSVIGDQFYSWK